MTKPSPTDIIEAVLFASDRPVPFKKLAQILDLPPDAAQDEIDILREEKARIGGLQLVEVAGGWQIVTKPEFAAPIRLLRDVPRQRLSRAAFEVLAIVAYRQPATRSDIEGLRGVDCAAPVQFLLEKKLITFAGRKETPGRPHLFATTPQFLDHFGLRDIADLPSLAELSELNDTGPIKDGDSLFNRGAMRTPEEIHAEADDEPVAELNGAPVSPEPDTEDSALLPAEVEPSTPVEGVHDREAANHAAPENSDSAVEPAEFAVAESLPAEMPG